MAKNDNSFRGSFTTEELTAMVEQAALSPMAFNWTGVSQSGNERVAWLQFEQ